MKVIFKKNMNEFFGEHEYNHFKITMSWRFIDEYVNFEERIKREPSERSHSS